MKFAVLPLLAVAALLSACAEEPDPWVSQASLAAAAQPGVRTLVATYVDLGPECAIGEPVPVEIVTQGKLGEASVGPATQTIVAPDQECDGKAADATGVYYEAPAGVSGIDTIVYREMRAAPRPDVVHTARIRVR